MSVRVINADVRAGLARLADESVHCVVTSPPYWGLRDYGIEPQIWGDWRGSLGLEPTPDCGRPKMRLRSDLTPKQREFVIQQLKSRGLL